MPTIVRFAGYRVVIYSNDHRPEHVHVIGEGVELVLEVNCPNGEIELRENYGATRKQIAQNPSSTQAFPRSHLRSLGGDPWQEMSSLLPQKELTVR